jgi:HAD superfamily hydrolase (TIGR01450 family)
MGAPVSSNSVVSSARATAAYLRDHDPGIRRVLVLGGSGLERELRDEGYEVVTSGVAATRMSQEPIDGFAAAGNPDAVVVGLDPNLTYARLVVASDSIRAGAHFIATNRDPIYPSERGLRPGAGALVIALEYATGIVPVSIGKPAPYLLEAAAHAVGREPAEAIMIGDGIGTDLAAARAVGARCVFMLTGVTTLTEVVALPADERPAAIAADAEDLARILDGLEAG